MRRTTLEKVYNVKIDEIRIAGKVHMCCMKKICNYCFTRLESCSNTWKRFTHD